MLEATSSILYNIRAAQKDITPVEDYENGWYNFYRFRMEADKIKLWLSKRSWASTMVAIFVLAPYVYLCEEDKAFSGTFFFNWILPFLVSFFLFQLAVIAASRDSKLREANSERDVYRDKLLEIKKLSKECATVDYRSNGRKCPVLRKVAEVAEVK